MLQTSFVRGEGHESCGSPLGTGVRPLAFGLAIFSYRGTSI